MTYHEAVAAIAALEPRGWRLGLDRMTEFCCRADLTDSLGTPGGPQFIHVAGTNGKGSTTEFLQRILTTHGYRTGGFFSPYVVDYRERIQLNCEMISPEDLADLTSELLPIGESLCETEFGGATKFEFEAGLGFLYWKWKQCDWVALEVGLGGRLDATNVVTPRCSVIVSIGLDHVSILGETLAAIAAEKAGIVKPGVPVIVGDMSPEALAVIEQRAADLNAPIWRFGQEILLTESPDGFSVQTPQRLHTGLRPSMEGAMLPHNLALAVAALDASGAAIREDALQKGAAQAFAPGRFQRARYKSCDLLLDGAHNHDAAIALRQTLELAFGDRTWHLVSNMLSGHDPLDFYRVFLDRIDSIDLVPIDFVRAMAVETAAATLKPLFAETQPHDSVLAGLEAACQKAGEKGLVVVTGSNYLVGEVTKILETARRPEGMKLPG